MRISCRLLATLLLVSCPLLVRAVTVRIQDPNFDNITSSPASFTFTACPTASDPGGPYDDNGTPITSDGCYGGVNQTGATIESITLTFQNTAAIQNSGQNAVSSDIFSTSSFTAPADPSDPSEDYSFVFSGNGLVQGQTFVITEDGVTDPSQFPTVTLAFTTNAATPEPSPLLLLATGLVCAGGLSLRRRLA